MTDAEHLRVLREMHDALNFGTRTGQSQPRMEALTAAIQRIERLAGLREKVERERAYANEQLRDEYHIPLNVRGFVLTRFDAVLALIAGDERMSDFCVMCGSRIPDDQGSRTCSMCYGDVGHGKDGYYRKWLEQDDERQRREQEREDGTP